MLISVRSPTIQLAKRVVLVSGEINHMITKMKLVRKKRLSFSKHLLYASQICAPTVPAMNMICFLMCKDGKNITA
jgi:hypothetical protein